MFNRTAFEQTYLACSTCSTQLSSFCHAVRHLYVKRLNVWMLLCVCQQLVDVLQVCWIKGKIADLGCGPAHLTTLTSLPFPSSALPIVLRLSTVGSPHFPLVLLCLPRNNAYHHPSI